MAVKPQPATAYCCPTAFFFIAWLGICASATFLIEAEAQQTREKRGLQILPDSGYSALGSFS